MCALKNISPSESHQSFLFNMKSFRTKYKTTKKDKPEYFLKGVYHEKDWSGHQPSTRCSSWTWSRSAPNAASCSTWGNHTVASLNYLESKDRTLNTKTNVKYHLPNDTWRNNCAFKSISDKTSYFLEHTTQSFLWNDQLLFHNFWFDCTIIFLHFILCFVFCSSCKAWEQVQALVANCVLCSNYNFAAAVKFRLEKGAALRS